MRHPQQSQASTAQSGPGSQHPLTAAPHHTMLHGAGAVTAPRSGPCPSIVTLSIHSLWPLSIHCDPVPVQAAGRRQWTPLLGRPCCSPPSWKGCGSSLKTTSSPKACSQSLGPLPPAPALPCTTTYHLGACLQLITSKQLILVRATRLCTRSLPGWLMPLLLLVAFLHLLRLTDSCPYCCCCLVP